MPFSIFKRTSGACPVHPPSLRGWQTFVLAGRVYPPPPCHFFAPPLHSLHNYAKICCATQYFFCFLVLSPLSSPTQPVLLAFWTGTATGIFRLPPAPPSPPLPHLFLHVFLWPRRELAQLQLPRALIFPDYFFCSITFLWPGAGRDSTSSSASFWPFYA